MCTSPPITSHRPCKGMLCPGREGSSAVQHGLDSLPFVAQVHLSCLPSYSNTKHSDGRRGRDCYFCPSSAARGSTGAAAGTMAMLGSTCSMSRICRYQCAEPSVSNVLSPWTSMYPGVPTWGQWDISAGTHACPTSPMTSFGSLNPTVERETWWATKRCQDITHTYHSTHVPSMHT